jgi:GT2 family glycosyltransferase
VEAVLVRISLVISTTNRPREISALLNSLYRQTVKPHQVVVVDQSADNATERSVLASKNELPVTYLRDDRKGLSRGRNLGVSLVNGDVVAFPDDDCVYPPDTLDKVQEKFSSDPALDILTGMSITPTGIPSQGRWGSAPRPIDRYNIWTSQTSYTTFYKTETFHLAGVFNEELGVGSGTKWGAGEETELMLRALRNGAKALYDPAIKVMHPEPLAEFDQTTFDRGRRYNRGFGRVMRMERYPLWFVAYMSGRPLIGAAVALLRGQRGQAKYRLIAFKHRLRGWADA